MLVGAPPSGISRPSTTSPCATEGWASLGGLRGKEYGSGSSRIGPRKARPPGVKAVVAESFERIHRSNLVGMGILPLELEQGVSVESLALDGSEAVDITGVRTISRRVPRCSW